VLTAAGQFSSANRKSIGINYRIIQFQFIDSMQQLHHDKMIANMRTRWKRTKRNQSAL